MKNETMKLPANCALLDKNELHAADGGALSDAGKAMLALGAIGAALCVGAVVLRSLLNGGLDGLIRDSINAGQSFIDGSESAGKEILGAITPKA